MCFVAEIDTVMSQAVVTHKAVLSAPRSAQKASISGAISSSAALAPWPGFPSLIGGASLSLCFPAGPSPLSPLCSYSSWECVCGSGLPLLSRACLISPLIFINSDSALGVYFSTAECFGTFSPFVFIFLYVFFKIV